ncbi:MAG: type II toxin-antitoxin system PemK/MazF family toxin, partial [Acidimicrobiales bacterium]
MRDRRGRPCAGRSGGSDRCWHLGLVARGEVWWVDFGAPIGSDPGHRRPVVVVSDDRFNRSRLNTVIVVAVTSNLRIGDRPGNIVLAKGDGGLDRTSVVNITQVSMVDR